jgi:hypothetical protein
VKEIFCEGDLYRVAAVVRRTRRGSDSTMSIATTYKYSGNPMFGTANFDDQNLSHCY